MEPYDNIVSHLVPQMSADEDQFFNIPTERSTKELKEIIEKSKIELVSVQSPCWSAPEKSAGQGAAKRGDGAFIPKASGTESKNDR